MGKKITKKDVVDFCKRNKIIIVLDGMGNVFRPVTTEITNQIESATIAGDKKAEHYWKKVMKDWEDNYYDDWYDMV